MFEGQSGVCIDCGMPFQLSYYTYPPTIRCPDCASILYLLNNLDWYQFSPRADELMEAQRYDDGQIVRDFLMCEPDYMRLESMEW